MLSKTLKAIIFSTAVFGFTYISDATAQRPSGPPKRSIKNVTGDIYRYQNNFHFGMLVVTKDSVVVKFFRKANVQGMAAWLKK